MLLSDRRLDLILTRLRKIPHLEIIRIGSRVPCHLPERITPELCKILHKHHPLYINTHFNHPAELTPQAVKGLGMLADAGVPFVLHVGGDPLQIHPDWMNTGKEVPTDWLGGGENVRSKDMTSLHHKVETFLGAMVLDGVLERFPRLRGGAIELGAGWVPSMLKRFDWSADIWRKSEPELAKLDRKPSEQITAQLAFTPFVYEDVGELISQSNDELYLFSSDYPHFEGGRHPLGRFEKSLAGHSEESQERFYSQNFARLFGL